MCMEDQIVVDQLDELVHMLCSSIVKLKEENVELTSTIDHWKEVTDMLKWQNSGLRASARNSRQPHEHIDTNGNSHWGWDHEPTECMDCSDYLYTEKLDAPF